MNSPLRRFMTALVLAFLTTPIWGYVVLLKDGTQIITREKYRREGNKVYLILPSGTETFIDASEVDFAKTEELNKTNVGQVKVIEQGETVIEEGEDDSPQQQSLRDLAGRTSLALPQTQATPDREAAVPLTKAGFVDLWSFNRNVHPDFELTDEIGRHLAGQGVEDYKLYQGTAEGHVLLELTATHEGAVFEGIRNAASALIHAQSQFPDRIEVLELVMSTDTEQRAGQFMLTRDLANKYLSGAVDQSTFFTRFVQF